MFAAILRASLRISISAKETKPRGTNYAYRDCHASLSGGGPRLAVDGGRLCHDGCGLHRYWRSDWRARVCRDTGAPQVIPRASSWLRNLAGLTLLGLSDQLDEAFYWLNLLAFVIVKLWIVVAVDGRT